MTARKQDGTPCHLCKLCDECGLLVHDDKPNMHHGSCSKFSLAAKELDDAP